MKPNVKCAGTYQRNFVWLCFGTLHTTAKRSGWFNVDHYVLSSMTLRLVLHTTNDVVVLSTIHTNMRDWTAAKTYPFQGWQASQNSRLIPSKINTVSYAESIHWRASTHCWGSATCKGFLWCACMFECKQMSSCDEWQEWQPLHWQAYERLRINALGWYDQNDFSYSKTRVSWLWSILVHPRWTNEETV